MKLANLVGRVIHLTTAEGRQRILRNPKELVREGRVKTLFENFDDLSLGSPNRFLRTGAIFAYPDIPSINRGRIISLHPGEEAVLICVDPAQAMVADAFFIDAYGRLSQEQTSTVEHWAHHSEYSGLGMPPAGYYADEADAYARREAEFIRKEVAVIRQYLVTAISLKAFIVTGNPGFIYPEVVIPANSEIKVEAPPADFSIEKRKIAGWEKEFRGRFFREYKIPGAKFHPWGHTLAVVDQAAALAAKECPENLKAVIFGAYLHDIAREDDESDRDHGQRSSLRIREFVDAVELSEVEIESLTFAVAHHSDRVGCNQTEPITDNFPEIRSRGLNARLIGVIWDADRLQLYRMGLVNPGFLSTVSARIIADRLNAKARARLPEPNTTEKRTSVVQQELNPRPERRFKNSALFAEANREVFGGEMNDREAGQYLSYLETQGADLLDLFLLCLALLWLNPRRGNLEKLRKFCENEIRNGRKSMRYSRQFQSRLERAFPWTEPAPRRTAS